MESMGRRTGIPETKYLPFAPEAAMGCPSLKPLNGRLKNWQPQPAALGVGTATCLTAHKSAQSNLRRWYPHEQCQAITSIHYNGPRAAKACDACGLHNLRPTES